MGCTQATESGEERLNKNLEKCKQNLLTRVQDPKMMEKIVEFMSVFLQTVLAGNPRTTVPSFMKHANLALYAARLTKDGGGAGGVNLGDKWVKGFKQLACPELFETIRDLDDNFLSVAGVMDEMNGKMEAYQPRKNQENDGEGYLKPTINEEEKEFLQDQQKMLNILMPMFHVIEGLPQKWVEKIFGRGEKEAEALQWQLKMQVGRAAMTIKVAGDGNMSGHRAAFIGPESIGKSTAINYITSGGSGEELMPVSPGMGTQSLCFVSDGVGETVQIGEKKYPSSQVVSEMKKYNQFPKPWDEMELLRATRPFPQAPSGIDLIDVPGLKAGTKMDTVLALSISSTLVLCVGESRLLASNLKNGSLCLLPDMVKQLEKPIPILCLVTKKGLKESDFQSDQKQLDALLKTYFPGSKITLQFGNFHIMTNLDKKREAIQLFWSTVQNHTSKESNPYKAFLQVREDLERFTKGLCNELRNKYNDYFKNCAKDLSDVEDNLKNSLKDMNDKDEHTVKKIMKESAISELLDDSNSLKQLPVFSLQLRSGEKQQSRDVAYVTQETLDELRLDIKKGLVAASQDVFETCLSSCMEPWINKCFSLKKGTSGAKQEKEAGTVMAAMLCKCINHVNGADEENEYLKMCRSLATLISQEAFTWVGIGYYMIESDEFNKSQLMQGVVRFKNEMNNADRFAQWRSKNFGTLRIDWEKYVQTVKNQRTTTDTNIALVTQICEAAKTYVSEIKRAKLLNYLDEPLKLLVEQSYIMLHRLLLVYRMEAGKGRLAFTGLIETLKEETKHNHSDSVEKMNKDATTDEKLSYCLETRDVLIKLKGAARDMEEIDAHLEKMGAISKAIKTPFNHKGTSIFFVVPVPEQNPAPQQIIKEAQQTRAIEFTPQSMLGNDDKPVTALIQECSIETGNHGAHVVVWFRREDVGTVDPEDGQGEVSMLTTFNKNPHITTLYVVLANLKTTDVETSRENWEKHAKNLQIKFIQLDQFQKEVKSHLMDMQEDARAAVSMAPEKLKRIQQKFDRLFKEVTKTSEKICTAKHEIANLSPEGLHRLIVDDGRIRKAVDAGLSKVKGRIGSEKFEVPDPKMMQRLFIKKTADRDDTTKEGGGTVNEFEGRVFILQVMLGQTIEKARNLASEVYDQTFTVAFDELAELFCLQAPELKKAIEGFINDAQTQKGEENDREAEVYGYVVKEHFIEMYVGVVISIAMPLLSTTVVPLIVDNANELSDKEYRKAYEYAKNELTQSSKSSGRRGLGRR